MAIKFSAARKNASLDAKLDVLNSGFIRIYSGTRPATPDTALSGNTLLAQLALGATAFAAATGGTKTANAITQDSAADATGTATFFRAVTSGGTAVVDGDVGIDGAGAPDMSFVSTSFVLGMVVQMTSWVFTEGN